MNAPAPALSAGNFLARFDASRATLPGDPLARERAADYLRRHGLPGPRDEAWKYTSLRPLAEHPAAETETIAAALPDLGALAAAPRLVFVNGRHAPDLGHATPYAIAALADAPPPADAAVALNTLLAEDGAHIEIPAATDAGLLLLIHLGQGPAAAFPRHSIALAAGARLTLLEIAAGTGPYLHNAVTRIRLAPGAHLTHARLQNEDAASLHLATIDTDIADGATYDGFTLTLGARLARATLRATLNGPRAHAALNAAQRIGGHQHADFTTLVRHAAPDCTSRQTVKNVLDGHARAVFQGRIEVDRIAQRTDGYQMNQALLLSDHAEIDSKPELEIFADDVKCSHGATVGALDADQLFYLASRGIPRAEARAMLVHAFLEDALAAIENTAVRDYLTAMIETPL